MSRRFRLPRGTRDFAPEEMAKRSYAERLIRRVFERYGFQQVQTPIFETFALFALRSGEEIRSKMFVFTVDGEEMVLRPEVTAAVCRMISMGELDLSKKPLRLYYVGQCYRYEEPQAGRYREFWQAGVELMGSPNPEADAEVIALAVDVIRELGIKGFELRVGDMRVIRGLLSDSGVPEEAQNRVIGPLDVLGSSVDKLTLYADRLKSGGELTEEELADLSRRLDDLRLWKEEEYRRMASGESKLPPSLEPLLEVDPRVYTVKELYKSGRRGELAELVENSIRDLKEAQKARWVYYGIEYEENGELKKAKLSSSTAEALLRTMSLRGPRNSVLSAARRVFSSYPSALRALDVYREVLDLLPYYGVEDYVADLSIARGLEYYTGTVFEIHCPYLGAQKQVCGGGRYDKLVEEFGGPSMPATGFALGFDRLVLAMEKSGVEFPPPARADVYVAAVSASVIPYAIEVSRKLREAGVRVEMDIMRRSIRESLSFASRMEIPFVAIVGEKEAAEGKVALRIMGEKKQVTLTPEEAAALVASRVGAR